MKYQVDEIVNMLKENKLSEVELNILCHLLEKLMMSTPTGHATIRFTNQALMEAAEEHGKHVVPKVVVNLVFDIEGIPEEELEAISDEDIEALLKALAEPEEGGQR